MDKFVFSDTDRRVMLSIVVYRGSCIGSLLARLETLGYAALKDHLHRLRWLGMVMKETDRYGHPMYRLTVAGLAEVKRLERYA